MQIKMSPVRWMIATLALLGLIAGTASASRVQQPWQFAGTDTTFSSGGLTVRTRVDLNPFFPETTLVNNLNLRANSFFNSEQQCWDGALKTGPSRSGALVGQQSRTTACPLAIGTGAGHAWMSLN